MHDSNWVYLLAGFGLLKAASMLFGTLSFLYRHRLFQSPNLVNSYGKGWAVVTGASDGIGLELSRQLAQMGFNICLIARDPSKLQRCAKDIETTFKVNTRVLVCDFS
jgi:FlaA1/EpsC-like NDP-sugar epimerase